MRKIVEMLLDVNTKSTFDLRVFSATNAITYAARIPSGTSLVHSPGWNVRVWRRSGSAGTCGVGFDTPRVIFATAAAETASGTRGGGGGGRGGGGAGGEGGDG